MLHVPRFDVERKENRAETAFLHAIDARAIGIRRIAAEIVIIIRHRRRDVVVRINHNRAAMNGQRTLPQRFVTRRARRCLGALRRLRRALPLSGVLRDGGNCRRENGNNEKRNQCDSKCATFHVYRFITNVVNTEAVFFAPLMHVEPGSADYSSLR